MASPRQVGDGPTIERTEAPDTFGTQPLGSPSCPAQQPIEFRPRRLA